MGNLARDPEIRYTAAGKAVASFSIAVNEGYGENQKATFIPIVAFDKLAEICGNNLIKGRKILVEGRMQVRNYEGKDGIKRYVTEVIAQNIEFMDSKKSESKADQWGMGSEVSEDESIPF